MSLSSSPSSLLPFAEDQLQKAVADLASLQRVSHRLAQTEASNLPNVLDKLLPRLLIRIGDNRNQLLSTNHVNVKYKLDQVHVTLVEMMSHILKRVKADPNCQLPVKDIIAQLCVCSTSSSPQAESIDALTMNLSLTFSAIGLSRLQSSPHVLLPDLMNGWRLVHSSSLDHASDQRMSRWSHLVLLCLEQVAEHEIQPDDEESLRKFRTIMMDDDFLSALLYSLLLDVVLYEPCHGVPGGNSHNNKLPSEGLSQVATTRLVSGPSIKEKDWGAEMNVPARRATLKLRILTLLSPRHPYSVLFSPMPLQSSRRAESSPSSRDNGWARAMVLLVLLSGDAQLNVADQAKSFWKIFKGSHVDHQTQGVNDDAVLPRACVELLSLSAGQVISETALQGIKEVALPLSPPSLPLSSASASSPRREPKSDPNNNTTPSVAVLLASKRRAMSESHRIVAMDVVARALKESPRAWQHNARSEEEILHHGSNHNNLLTMTIVATKLARSMLSSGSCVTGLTLQRAKPQVACAQLLQALSTRVARFLDTTNRSCSSLGSDNSLAEMTAQFQRFLSEALAIACSVVSVLPQRTSVTAVSSSAAFGNEGNLVVRELCYEIICTVIRCSSWTFLGSPLFNCGDESPNEGSLITRSTISTATVHLLLQCAIHEEERLRPRAVEALDALLGAYQSVLTTHTDEVRGIIALPLSSVGSSFGIEMDSVTSTCLYDTTLNPWESINVPSLPASSMEVSERNQALLDADRIQVASSLISLLWSAAQTYQTKASRLVAAHWTGDLLKELDTSSACHLLCYLAGDADPAVVSMALNSLGIPKPWDHTQFERTNMGLKLKIPQFSEFVHSVFSCNALPSDRLHHYSEFSFEGKASALRFGMMCLLNDLYDADNKAVSKYLSVLVDTLHQFQYCFSDESITDQYRFSIELLDETSACVLSLLTTSPFARTQILTKEMTLNLHDMENMAISVTSSTSRRKLALVCGCLYEAFEFWESRLEIDAKFKSWALVSGVEAALQNSMRGLQRIDDQKTTGRLHGITYLSAALIRAVQNASLRYTLPGCCLHDDIWEGLSFLVTNLGRGLRHTDEAIASASVEALANALSFEWFKEPILDKRLCVACSIALDELTYVLSSCENQDPVDLIRTARLARACGIVLAASNSSTGMSNVLPSRIQCTNALLNLLGSSASCMDEEIALVAGEALALYADSYNPDHQCQNSSNGYWPSDYNEDYAKQLPPHQHVLYVLLEKSAKSLNPHVRNACAPALLAMVARVARLIHYKPMYSQRNLSMEILKRLEIVQKTFIKFLVDPKIKHLPREACCLGLVACSGITNFFATKNESRAFFCEAINERLLHAFGQTNKYAESAYIETSAQAAERRASEFGNSTVTNSAAIFSFSDEEIGGAAGMNEAALDAYREIAAAAVALKRYDILYNLLILSVTHPSWSDGERHFQYNPRALLGDLSFVDNKSRSLEMQQALRPLLGKLIPRILRARHDPNKLTREQMNALWIGLTGGGADARLILSNHFKSTVDELIRSTSGKLWRTRVGACGALAEVLIGRSWNDLGGGEAFVFDEREADIIELSAGVRLLRLWNATMRSMDDVRGAVRDSGCILGRAVKNLTIRLCSSTTLPSDDLRYLPRGHDETFDEMNVNAASATAIRWLTKYGLEQQCPEGSGLCISTLVEVVSTAKPVVLSPLLPSLLRSLLIAISGLEPAALSYVQLRTVDQDGLERIRLKLAQRGPLAVAVTKCLELLPETDISTQHAAVSQLDSALRSSAGFASRAAVADSVSTLCSICPSAFKFPYASSANPSVRLLRGLYYAGERERTTAAKEKLVHALGNLAALCPGSSIRALCLRACDCYNRSSGSYDDPKSRRTAALTVRVITIRSSNQLSNGGNSDIWRTRIFPVAYVGRKDEDSAIATLWQEVWDEANSILEKDIMSKHHSFSYRMEEIMLPYLVKEAMRAIKDVAWARRISGIKALDELVAVGVLSPLPTTLSQKSPELSNCMRRERLRAEAACVALLGSVELISKPRLWTGKSIVLSTIIDIALPWIGYESNVAINAEDLYSFKEESSRPISLPISLLSASRNDLFIGDQWFTSIAQENVAAVDQENNDPSQTIDVDQEDDDFDSTFTDNVNEITDLRIDATAAESEITSPFSSPLTLLGLLRLLFLQTKQNTTADFDEVLLYRIAALKGIKTLMSNISSDACQTKSEIFTSFFSDLVPMISLRNSNTDLPPVAVAGALGVLGSMFWDGFGGDESIPTVDTILSLIESTRSSHAWTVREASILCMSSLVLCGDSSWLRQSKIVSAMIRAAQESLNERKFWRVRLAGVTILKSLTSRVGDINTPERNKQIPLEAVLPYKESIVQLIQGGLKDTESSVSTLCSQLMFCTTCWP